MSDLDLDRLITMGLLSDAALVSINIIYRLPDHHAILQEFVWQTVDLRPMYPRITRFLRHWQREQLAPIHDVLLLDAPYTGGDWRHAKALFGLM